MPCKFPGRVRFPMAPPIERLTMAFPEEYLKEIERTVDSYISDADKRKVGSYDKFADKYAQDVENDAIAKIAELQREIETLKRKEISADKYSDRVYDDPGVPACVECDEEIYSGINGYVQVLKQNGGYEWCVYCAACDFVTFSQTFTKYDDEE